MLQILNVGQMGLEPERTAFDDLSLEAVFNSLVHIHSGVLRGKKQVGVDVGTAVKCQFIMQLSM